MVCVKILYNSYMSGGSFNMKNVSVKDYYYYYMDVANV